MFLLEFILYDRPVQKISEWIKELELSNNCVTVVETMSQDWSNSSLELFDSLSKLVEIVIEFSPFDIHDIVSISNE